MYLLACRIYSKVNIVFDFGGANSLESYYILDKDNRQLTHELNEPDHPWVEARSHITTPGSTSHHHGIHGTKAPAPHPSSHIPKSSPHRLSIATLVAATITISAPSNAHPHVSVPTTFAYSGYKGFRQMCYLPPNPPPRNRPPQSSSWTPSHRLLLHGTYSSEKVYVSNRSCTFLTKI